MIIVGIRDALWGTPTLVLLLAFGAYFTVKLRLWKPNTILNAFKSTFFSGAKKGNGNNLSSMAALATALGGTVGVGSISGVALAISLGGAGSIFWMWICSFLGMGLKYAEVALIHRRRKSTPRGFAGGAMYCLRDMGCGKLAVFFALVCVVSAFAGGSVVQAKAISDVIALGVPTPITRATIIGVAALLAVWGGRKSIAKVNTLALPLVSALFIIGAFGIIALHIKDVPLALGRIFKEAFGVRQAVGGIGAATVISVGCTRGTFSHEAGMGSSPISYAAATETDSHTQGLWGITEVFIDSFIVSTLTALCILCTQIPTVDGAFITCYGALGGAVYGVALIIFAFAAIISWCFYGEEALAFLLPNKKVPHYIFKILVAIGATVGALLTEGAAFALADIWSVFMLLPNIFLLYKSRSDIVALAKQNR